MSGPNVEQQTVIDEATGEIISTQTVSSKTRTVETITVSLQASSSTCYIYEPFYY